MKSSGRQRGFTLMELMIGVAIVGILAAVAYPSYSAHIRRGKIASALAELSTVRVRLEQYYQDNRNYGTTATSCPVALPGAIGFSLTCTWGSTSNPQSFLLTATGQDAGGMTGYVYTVDQANQQRTEQFDGEAVGAACWIKKKGESC